MPGQRSDAPAHRMQLIEAARRVFAARGIAAEVKDIAAEAGIGIGTFYRNFPRKEDLIKALLDEASAEMDAGFDDARLGDRTGIERLRVVLVHACKAVYAYGWLLEALWTGQLPAELIQHDEDRSKRDLFHAFLRQGIDEGALRPDIDPDLVVSMLMGPILFHSHLPLGEDPEEAAESLIRVILDGIARRG